MTKPIKANLGEVSQAAKKGVTIPGGAYIDAAGNWVNAEGDYLTAEQVKEWQALQSGKPAQPEAKPAARGRPAKK